MNFADNLTTNTISLFSLIIALTTFYFYFRDRNREKFIIKKDYKKELLDWYSKTIETLILLRCCDLGEDRQKYLSLLSSQIEIGRFYFPNIDKGNDFGKNKPLAYQGYRNLILDFLVYSYTLLNKVDYKNNLSELEVFQREFTSLVYSVIKPSESLLDIKKMTDKYFAEERIFEDYLRTKDPKELIKIINKIHQ